MKPILAAIGDLNAAPLFGPLLSGSIASDFEVCAGSPADANRLITSGRAGGGIMSVAAWRRAGGEERYERLCGLEIASDGPVGSILLFRAAGVERPRRVAVTNQSSTSVELLRILWRRNGWPLEIDPTEDPLAALAIGDRYDGALVIGDEALAARGMEIDRWDLGEMWREEMGLPMVYAVMVAARDRGESDDIRRTCSQALDWSRSHLDEVLKGWYDRTSVERRRRIVGHWTDQELLGYLERLDKARGHADLDRGLDRFLELMSARDEGTGRRG